VPLNRPRSRTDAEARSAVEYRDFAAVQVRGKSPLYEQLCHAIADDKLVLSRIAALPRERQQPNLLLAAVRYLFGTPRDWEAFREVVLTNWPAIAEVILTRRTQTNEVGRCAPLLVLLAQLPQPLALLEVGASAGLCLLPDRYSYRFGDVRLGASELELECALHGEVPVPAGLPEIVWRAGLDLDPLDVRERADVQWLESLVWPEQHRRLEQLRRAVAIAREDPPTLVRADMVEGLLDLAAEAPKDATLVVFHTAALAYLPRRRRREFEAAVGDLSVVWIAQEAPGVVALAEEVTLAPPAPAYFIGSVDAWPRLLLDSHGGWVQRAT
jgi:hypothetical protein